MTNFGDIVDCIDINKQLAFDHPLLKNHKLQIAEVFLLPQFGPYYGVSGINSAYNPRVNRMDQISASHLWVQNGQMDDSNKIAAGWHVHPHLYGDDATYLYSAWTSDNFKKTGCFNIRCPGFVQTSKVHYLGARVRNTSIYGGIMFDLAVSISQDPVTKNWWLNMQNTNIGYFPAALFSNMASADRVGWGGRTRTPPNTLSPPMGSGHFPDNNFVHACYFEFVSFKNASRQNCGPEKYQTQVFTDKSYCFGVEYYGNQGVKVGYSLQFGGPGGNCGN
ncbi:hypothetical protein E2542_SST20504 [Spatholobus suberectus]|nr:hypothetical protein E2542_SST20504 [Spatholobus suberectus]